MNCQTMLTAVLYFCILARTQTTISPAYLRKWHHQFNEQFARQQNQNRGQASRQLPTLREAPNPQLSKSITHQLGEAPKPQLSKAFPPQLRESPVPQVKVTPNHGHFGYTGESQPIKEQPASVGKPPVIQPGQLTDSNGHLRGQLTDNNGHIRGQLTDSNGHIRGQLTGSNGHIRGQLTDSNGHIRGQLTDSNGHIRGQINLSGSGNFVRLPNRDQERVQERIHSTSRLGREWEPENMEGRRNNGAYARERHPGSAVHPGELENGRMTSSGIPTFVYEKYRHTRTRNFGMCNPSGPTSIMQTLSQLKTLFPNKFMSEQEMRQVVSENKKQLTASRRERVRHNHQLKIKDISDREFAFQVASDTVDSTPPDQQGSAMRGSGRPGLRCEPDCCDTFRSHMHYQNITFEGRDYPLVNLENEYQFIHVGECPEVNTCSIGRCFQHYSTQYVLVWNVTVDYWPPIDIVANEFPSHCQWVNT